MYVCTITFRLTRHRADSPSLTSNVPVNRTWQVRSGPAGHNGQGQVKQLSAVIWKWSLWAVNTVVSSRSVCAALPRHIIVNSRQHTRDPRCTLLSERIKCSSTEMLWIKTMTMAQTGPKPLASWPFCYFFNQGNVLPSYCYMWYILFLSSDLCSNTQIMELVRW